MAVCSVAKQSLVALSSGKAEFYGIVGAVATSKQTSQILEQTGMKAEVTLLPTTVQREGYARERDQERYDIFQSKCCGYRRLTARRSCSWCRWIRS